MNVCVFLRTGPSSLACMTSLMALNVSAVAQKQKKNKNRWINKSNSVMEVVHQQNCCSCLFFCFEGCARVCVYMCAMRILYQLWCEGINQCLTVMAVVICRSLASSWCGPCLGRFIYYCVFIASFSWSMVCLRHLCTVLNYSFIDKDDGVLTYGGYCTHYSRMILSMSAFISLGTKQNFDHVSVIDCYFDTLKRINHLFREHQYCLLQMM